MVQAHVFSVDDLAVINETQVLIKITGVIRVGESFKYLDAKGAQYWECDISAIPNTKPKFMLAPEPIKMFAYRNLRTTRIDHYEYEWAGNQFARRCPEHDIEKKLA